ncbi:type II secretion system F family protein [Cellulomonas chengniuliangii]|uniref:Type II secretion system F family protein n=1 Tax=Cellulomonas chengniuliangii TaxID=2968084 RepID=A0ABY5KWT9_9CELL|nr:type II secretion system F family protein [Cellulomonas chengniuliangii]MCC2309484.1 type II secretion system F family protein [Cellulomonas chengniuliangii]MCC2316755.1 type II secretion system F family protein [Cellulomonas chengniuliangii]UUI74957.1 type II secretion system F family protein [Cellulomonas chengniuliangii]
MTPIGVGVLVSVLLVGAGAGWALGPCVRRAAVAAPRAGGAGRDRDARAVAPLDVSLVLELVDVALATGVSVPHALQAVGAAVGGRDGEALERTGSMLVLGSSWQEAWARAPRRLEAVARCLEPAWSAGSAPGAALRSQAAAVRRGRQRAAREAAARMGVHLVLPLGLCFLPAFVLLGLAPVMLSLAEGLLQ